MEEEAGSTIIHEHCKTCYSTQCTVRPSPPESCAVVACTLHCGARFHECKQNDHRLHCSEERVACINHVNGCPVVLPRQQLGSHLETCPASVICCTMEWNRWPLYAPERQARVPFKLANAHARGGQLDVALALRDQRMLTKAMQAPSTTKRALRSHLTKRFPAVPINVRHIENVNPMQLPEPEGSSSEETEQGPEPDALKESQMVQLLKASKRASQTLTAALSLVTENKTDTAGCEKDEPLGHTETDTDNTLPEADNISSDNARETNCPGLETNHCGASATTGLSHAHIQPKGVWINTAIPSECRTPHSIPEPPPPPPGISLQEGLALDINLEQITRYQGKPKINVHLLMCTTFSGGMNTAGIL